MDDVTVDAFRGLIHDVTYAYLREEVYEEDDASVEHHEAAEVDEEGIVHEDCAETYPGASDDEWLARTGDKAVDVQKPHGDENEGDVEIVGEVQGNPLVKVEIDEETRRRTREREECAASVVTMSHAMRKIRRRLDQPMDEAAVKAAVAAMAPLATLAEELGL